MTRTMAETKKSKAAPEPAKEVRPAERNRETVESFVVAIILAVLIRGFIAEAFVIPTGSMAPTLMGKHKELSCPECGETFTVNVHGDDPPRRFDARPEPQEFGLCSNCRVPVRVDNLPSFKGDRILVSKFPYDLPFLPGASGPNRWDVVVFRFPGNPDQSYIKRLVGLPGDELLIRGGDVFVRRSADSSFIYARKPLEHQKAMQMLVYNDEHRPKALEGKREWQRWTATREGDWTEPRPGLFETTESTDWVELGYQHLVPTPTQWDDLLHGRPVVTPKPILITDNYSYNSSFTNPDYPWDDKPHWVGDLTLSCRLDVQSSQGTVALELVRGGVPFRCEVDLATGQAVFSKYGAMLGDPVATRLRGAGSFDVSFANVDGRLTLWVDGRTPTSMGEGLTHDEGDEPRPVPTEADLRPARIAARGAKVQVSRLQIQRDIYYTERPKRADYLRADSLSYDGAYSGQDELPNDPRILQESLGDPTKFAAFGTSHGRRFAIAPDKYMMMGDNSPESYDGREWNDADRDWDTTGRQPWEVPQSLLIGRAFFVYWPHGKPFWPDIAINKDFHVPFRPYVERMKWIR